MDKQKFDSLWNSNNTNKSFKNRKKKIKKYRHIELLNAGRVFQQLQHWKRFQADGEMLSHNSQIPWTRNPVRQPSWFVCIFQHHSSSPGWRLQPSQVESKPDHRRLLLLKLSIIIMGITRSYLLIFAQGLPYSSSKLSGQKAQQTTRDDHCRRLHGYLRDKEFQQLAQWWWTDNKQSSSSASHWETWRNFACTIAQTHLPLLLWPSDSFSPRLSRIQISLFSLMHTHPTTIKNTAYTCW